MGLLQKKPYKINKKQKIFLSAYALSAFVAVLFIVFLFRQNYPLISDAGNFASQAAYYPLQVLNNIFFAQSEIILLKKENVELKNELAKLSSVREENNFLKKSLDLIDFKGRLAQARILFYPIENKNQAYINRGRIDGINVGMPLVSGNYLLVGKVAHTEDHKSRIVFSIDEEFISPASIEGLNIKAAAKGNGNSITITAPINDESAKVLKDQMVFTGSADPLMPPRLVLGKIVSIEEDKKINIFRYEVKPLINRDEIFDVFIIK